ncbi:MAG: PocR ligand-binding domain-containing protein, partial [Desulfobulbaceae bacterium]|nr:PocR ligand-binding domain-containing protein [Desulfobulbaceae bacterium]
MDKEKMDLEQIAFKDLVDLDTLRLLFEDFSKATGFTTGLVDQTTNEVLIATGWRDICVKFHRSCPSSLEHCKKSNRELTSGILNAGDIRIHHCKNGLVDGCTPIIIAGRHFANLFTGQILFSPPDKKRFKRQAKEYGYDENSYLNALDKVPVVSEETFNSMLRYLAHTASIVGQIGLANLNTVKELRKSQEEWERTFNSITDVVTLQDTSMRILKVNQAGCDTLGLSCDAIIGHYCYELFHGSDEPCPECPLLVTKETFEPYTKEMTHEKLGKTFLVSASPVFDDKGKLLHIAHVAKDVTEHNKMKEKLFVNEKLATIAGLAAGVAHEINTPLSAILQSLQIIEMRLSPDKPRNQKRATECGVDLAKVETYFKNNDLDFFMKGIRDSAMNAGEIIKNLLEFSRPLKS